MKIDYLSDLHFEFGGMQSKLEGGDILLVAGDFCPVVYLNPERTDPQSRKVRKAVSRFEKECAKYKRVYGVMGNHDHYGGDFDETLDLLKERAGFIHWLEKEYIEEDGFLLYGASLWTNINHGHPLAEMCVKHGMNDFRAIRNLTVAVWKYDHAEALKAVPPMGAKPLVIMTHHAPSLYGLNFQEPRSDLDYAYASDLHSFIENRPFIKHWVHGHTHIRHDYDVAQCKVHSFAHGYERYAYWAKSFEV